MFNFLESKKSFEVNSKFKKLTEIRILNHEGKVWSGYFSLDEDGINAFKSKIERIKAETVYHTINELSEDAVQGKQINVLTVAATVTKDKDISTICWFPCDFDPKRPTNTSATDEEKKHALNQMLIMLRELKAAGFSDPLIVDSGNGYNVFYRVSMANTEENRKLLKSLNNILAIKYTNEKVDFDKSVTNPSRIFKVPGSVSAKGEETPERPHRNSEIVKIPGVISSTSIETIKAYIEKNVKILPDTSSSECSNKKRSKRMINFLGYLALHNMTYRLKKEDDGRILYLLDHCPMNHDHINSSSFTVFPNGNVAFSCFHTSCCDYTLEDVLTKFPETLKNRSISFKTSNDKRNPLYNYVIDNTEFLINQNDDYFALANNGRVYNINSSEFREYINSFTTEINGIYSNSSIDAVASTLSSVYHKYSTKLYVGQRLLQIDRDIYYNCGDKIISVKGGMVSYSAPKDVYFEYRNRQINQILPDLNVKAERLPDLIRKMFNLSEESFLTFLAHLVCLFVPNIKIPIMIINGTHGMGKSTAVRKIVSLVDPKNADIIAMPAKCSDVTPVLEASYLAAFDNVSSIDASISDVLCQSCTGGYINKRALYTTNTEYTAKLDCKIILDGIGDFVKKTDLAERINIIKLAALSENLGNEAIWKAFNNAKSLILGAIFNCISRALPIVDITKGYSHRMADFISYGRAFIQTMGLNPDQFESEFINSSREYMGICTENDDLCNIISRFLTDNSTTYSGTPTELFNALEIYAQIKKLPFKEKSPSLLSRHLNDNSNDLEKAGITFTRSKSGDRKIELTLLS